MGSIIWTAIIGLAIGAVTKFVMPGTYGGGIIVTMLLGIVGSVVASFIGQAVGFYPAGAGAGFIASVLGAVLILWLYGRLSRKG